MTTHSGPLTRDDVLLQVTRLDQLYPTSNMEPEELEEVADLWVEALAGKMTSRQFEAACKKIMAECLFFPVPAQVLKARDEIVREEQPVQRQALPSRKRSDKEMVAIFARIKEIEAGGVSYLKAMGQAFQEAGMKVGEQCPSA